MARGSPTTRGEARRDGSPAICWPSWANSISAGARSNRPGKWSATFTTRARDVLKFPLLDLTPADVAAVAEGFAEAITSERYTCYACAIMPDHVHIIIRKHKHQAEQMIEALQLASRLRLSTLGLRRVRSSRLGHVGLEGISRPPRRRAAAPFATSNRTRSSSGCPNSIGPSSNPTTAGRFTQVTIPIHPTQDKRHTHETRRTPFDPFHARDSFEPAPAGGDLPPIATRRRRSDEDRGAAVLDPRPVGVGPAELRRLRGDRSGRQEPGRLGPVARPRLRSPSSRPGWCFQDFTGVPARGRPGGDAQRHGPAGRRSAADQSADARRPGDRPLGAGGPLRLARRAGRQRRAGVRAEPRALRFLRVGARGRSTTSALCRRRSGSSTR